MDGNEQVGVRKKSPVQEPLSGGELCCYWCGNILMSLMTAFLLCCCGFFQVEPMTAIIFIAFGKIFRVEKESGLHWIMPVCLEKKHVNLSIVTMKVLGSNVPDSTGSPLNMAAIVNYIVTDPVKAEYNVEHLWQYIHTQAYDVVRRIAGKFRYRSNVATEVSLLDDSHHICKHMKDLLQKRCEIAGVEILRMDFIDISYHAEVAANLLQVQQAQARIDARKLIVAGSVEITCGALSALSTAGINLS
jgi:regulator of protease activity HflC (stomatin/prohibitin superfamily)